MKKRYDWRGLPPLVSFAQDIFDFKLLCVLETARGFVFMVFALYGKRAVSHDILRLLGYLLHKLYRSHDLRWKCFAFLSNRMVLERPLQICGFSFSYLSSHPAFLESFIGRGVKWGVNDATNQRLVSSIPPVSAHGNKLSLLSMRLSKPSYQNSPYPPLPNINEL